MIGFSEGRRPPFVDSFARQSGSAEPRRAAQSLPPSAYLHLRDRFGDEALLDGAGGDTS